MYNTKSLIILHLKYYQTEKQFPPSPCTPIVSVYPLISKYDIVNLLGPSNGTVQPNSIDRHRGGVLQVKGLDRGQTRALGDWVFELSFQENFLFHPTKCYVINPTRPVWRLREWQKSRA